MSELLVRATRNNFEENLYRGDVVIVDEGRKTLLVIGDAEKRTYWRSAAKPFQVLPFIEAGGLATYDISGNELALMTASHGGEPLHVKTLSGLLAKFGFTVSDLQCGSSYPMHQPSMHAMLRSGEPATPLHNCCSGKHAAMLAVALLKRYDPTGYGQQDHPVQQDLIKTIAGFTQLPIEKIGIGTDGCGVPIYYLPLRKMAEAYALLAKPEKNRDDARAKAIRSVTHAMTTFPWFVAGTGRLDTILMEVTGGEVLAKLGADGVYCVSLLNRGIGIALKIESGDVRVIDPVIVNILERLDLIPGEALKELKNRLDFSIYNHRGEVIGQLEVIG